MSANRIDTHCPECGTRDIDRVAVQEGGFMPGKQDDTGVYVCQRPECRHVWDTEMPRPDKPRNCAHDEIVDITVWGHARPHGMCTACGADMVEDHEGEWKLA